MELDEKDYNMEIQKKLMRFSVSLRENISYTGHNYYKDFELLPNIISTISPDEVDLKTDFLGRELDNPIMIAPLVGGFGESLSINEKIALLVEEKNMAMGIGDEVFALENDVAEDGYKIVKTAAPTACKFGNLPLRHLVHFKDPISKIKAAVDLIGADFIELSLNTLTELFQKGENSLGTPGFSLLSEICEKIDTKIIIRSMDSGFLHEDICQLWDMGVDGFDTQGKGGSNFVQMEIYEHMSLAQRQSQTKNEISEFVNWGVHTICSTADIKLRKANKDIPLICGGGIRNGLDIVKMLLLGADLVSIGFPVLSHIIEDLGYPNEDNLGNAINKLIYEVKMSMASLGVKNIKELKELGNNRMLITGKLRQWLKLRGHKLQYENCID